MRDIPSFKSRKWLSARILMVLAAALLTCLIAGQAALASASESTGSGSGGDSVPVLIDIQVSQQDGDGGLTLVTVKYLFSNNIGYYQDANRLLFHLQDQTGVSVAFSLSMWADSSNPLRREAWMAASLEPGHVLTASVDAGIMSKNGQVTASGGSKVFTVQAFAAPSPSPSPSPSPTPAVTTSTTASTGTSAATETETAASQTSAASATPAASESTDIATETSGQATSTTTQTSGSQTGSGGGTGGGKSQPLQLVSSTPANQTYNVPINSDIVLNFNKNVIYLLVREQNKAAITLWAGDQPVEAEILMADDQLEFEKRQEIIVHPVAGLLEKTTYTVRISGSLVSKSGATLGNPVEIHFYTIGYPVPLPVWIWVGGGVILLAGAGIVFLITTKQHRMRQRRQANG